MLADEVVWRMSRDVAEYAASQMRYWCVTTDDGGVGYSQPNRWSAYKHSDWEGWLKAPGEMDCSAGVAGAYNIGFYNKLPEASRPAMFPESVWTGSMRAECLKRGFSDIGATWTGNAPSGGFAVGDLLLKDGHVAMAVRNFDGTFDPQNPLLAEAWIDSAGDIMGAAGADGSPHDNTGSETRVIKYAQHPATRAASWGTCLRYTEVTIIADKPTTTTTATMPTPSDSGSLAWGVDISMHQDYGQVPADAEIVIIKATEGVGYEDPKWRSHAQKAWDQGKKVGLYHFARPDLGNSAEAEAAWFLKTIKDWIGYAVLVLDWEREPLGNVTWARTWLDKVWYGSPTRPWIYMNLSTARSHAWEPVSEHYPLWMASYDGRAWDDLTGPHPGHRWLVVAKQYTENPIDKNTFYFQASEWSGLVKSRNWPGAENSEEDMEALKAYLDKWYWEKLVQINGTVNRITAIVTENQRRINTTNSKLEALEKKVNELAEKKEA